jgi:hypothetical protein
VLTPSRPARPLRGDAETLEAAGAGLPDGSTAAAPCLGRAVRRDFLATGAGPSGEGESPVRLVLAVREVMASDREWGQNGDWLEGKLHRENREMLGMGMEMEADTARNGFGRIAG